MVTLIKLQKKKQKQNQFYIGMKLMVVLSTAFVVDRSHMNGLRLLEIDRDLTPNSTHCTVSFQVFLFTSLSCHFSCQKCGTTMHHESIGDL